MANIGMSVEYLGLHEFSDQWTTDNYNFTKIVKETGIADLMASKKK
jgi:hypothetical protein